jgi:DNA polymerase-3 subunit delta
MTPIYLLAGEAFLSEEALDRVRSEVGVDQLSEDDFDATAEIGDILSALHTSTLLGGNRLVIIRDAQDLKKDQVEALDAYLESPSPDVALVLIASGKTKLDARAKKTGVVVSLEPPKGRRLVSWIRDRARMHSVKVDDRAAWALTDSVGPDLRDLDGALSQLATALGSGAQVTAQEVKKAFARVADERIFAFTDAVGERKLAPAMTALRRLLDQGDEPLLVFGALNAHIKRLLRARRYADQGARAVGSALGLPEWRAERMQKQARTYREEELVKALSILADTDVDMKGEFPSPEIALERAVVRIVSGERAGV